MPAESEHFKTTIQDFPCDDDWNKENPLEKGYAAAGLKRYNLDNVWLTYQQLVHTEQEKEELGASKGQNASSSSNAAPVPMIQWVENGAAIQDGEVVVKDENPLLDQLNESILRLKSGKSFSFSFDFKA
jgi:hypothetical protein